MGRCSATGPTWVRTTRRSTSFAGGRVRAPRRPLHALLLRPDNEARAAKESDRRSGALRQLTAFFAWTAWAGSTERPGKSYTYTNNWPPEPRVDNKPTANVVVWSVLSLIALLGGIGLLFTAFGRWYLLGWHGREQAKLSFRAPGDVALTPSQRTCAWFFFVMAALFLIQTFDGWTQATKSCARSPSASESEASSRSGYCS